MGAPLSTLEALEESIVAHTVDLSNALKKMQDITKHDALIILRYSLGSTKLLHTRDAVPVLTTRGWRDMMRSCVLVFPKS